jgi:SAM-dependent methyltransferase
LTTVLSEPVAESSTWLDAIAPWTCRRTGGEDCSWYHGSWQYLRLLNLVSSPGWHTEFFVTALRRQVGSREGASVLVSGCADYSMYAHVLGALGAQARVALLDWCCTPLIAGAWYARHLGVEAPELLCEDATAHRPKQAYDAIVSDAFLPRFPPDQLLELLQAWRISLRPGGCAITTVRLHEGTPTEPVSPETTAVRWGRAAAAAAPWWPTVSILPVDELIHRAETFARRQERNAFYGAAEIEKLFNLAGFPHIEIQLADVAGKQLARVQAR